MIQLLDYIHTQYSDNFINNGKYTDCTLDLFDKLLAAHTDKFITFVNNEEDKWETSTHNLTDKETTDDLWVKVLQRYNNKLYAKRWKKTEDPYSKVISSLVTYVTDLERLAKESSCRQM